MNFCIKICRYNLQIIKKSHPSNFIKKFNLEVAGRNDPKKKLIVENAHIFQISITPIYMFDFLDEIW